MKYELIVRHSPCPRKRLIVEAGGVDEALELLVACNREAIRAARAQGILSDKRADELTALLDDWVAGGGLHTVDVMEAPDWSLPDWPRLPAVREQAPHGVDGKTHLGRLGRREGATPAAG